MRSNQLGLWSRNLLFTSAACALFALSTSQAAAASLWNWSYSASGINASGTFTTADTPDAMGGFLITAITGTRNGVTITGLQPAGTPIPGNEPFAVDNLVSLGPGPQLSKEGVGFSMADGTFSNPFFADFLSPPVYLEFFSNPSTGETTELPVEFSAARVATPEPATCALVFGVLALTALRRRRT